MYNIFITVIAWLSEADNIKYKLFKWLSNWKFIFLSLKDLLYML